MPVVSIGIPTVVDAATLAFDLLEEAVGKESEAFSEIVGRVVSPERQTMFVTPKDNDVITENSARLIATAINMAVHGMTASEINEFLS